jgi:hypothetical protein
MNPPEDLPADLRVWNAVLDRIEQSIRAVDPDGRLELEAEFEAIGGFEPPRGVGAMPEALLERAQALLEAVNATANRVAAAQRAIGDELARHHSTSRRPGTDPEPPPPALVDHDA